MTLLAKLLRRPARAPIRWLEAGELRDWLNNADAPLVIDVRSPDEFIGLLGHIASAQNIPLDSLPKHVDVLLAAQRPLVFVCHTDRRSSAAAALLQQAGLSKTAVLRGGMVAWRSVT
jgi:rhodanese-related sulfurtransferase